MDHRVHVRLLRDGVLGGGKIWADLGSGEGAFTLALADLLGPTGSIHTVDRDSRALQVQVRALRDAFPNVTVPLSFRSWATLAAEAGFRETQRLASVPSRFLASIYSALSFA